MNTRFVISVVVIFVMLMGLGFVVHGTLLHGDYAKLPGVMRADADQQKHMAFLLVGQLFAAIGFVWIYQKGKEDRPFLGQGLRYGLAMAAVMVVAKFLIYYAVEPLPGTLVCKQIVFDGIGTILMGVVVAALNK